VQLLLAPFAQFPVSFVAWVSALGIASVMIFILLRAALSTERRARWVKAITNANARYLFSFLWVAWLLFFGILLFIVPHEGAGTPYGAIGLIALFTGSFLLFGFLWAVIGE
jgi:hypothetical protein